MKHVLIFLSSLILSGTAMAADFGFEGGFRQQSGTVGGTGLTASSQNGFQLGVTALIPMSEVVPMEGAFALRTGLFYVQRPLLIKADSPAVGEAKINLTYFDVPLAFAYKFEDYANVFLGTALGLKLEDSVSGATGTLASQKVTDAKSLILPIQLGASFKFASQMGATVFYETVPGDVAKDLGSYRAVGLNFVFTYE